MPNQFHLSLSHEELNLIRIGVKAAIEEGYNNTSVVESLEYKIVEAVRYYYGDDK